MYHFIITLVLYFSFLNAFAACETDMSRVHALEENPQLAKTFLMGTVGGSAFKRIFFVRWPANTVPIKISSNRCLAPRAILQTQYLFVSDKKIEEIDKDDGIGMPDGIFVELKEAQKYIAQLASNKENLKGDSSVFWKYCQEDSQCATTKGSCGNFLSVNKKYQTEYLEFLNSQSFQIECPKSFFVGPIKPPEPKCIENICS